MGGLGWKVSCVRWSVGSSSAFLTGLRLCLSLSLSSSLSGFCFVSHTLCLFGCVKMVGYGMVLCMSARRTGQGGTGALISDSPSYPALSWAVSRVETTERSSSLILYPKRNGVGEGFGLRRGVEAVYIYCVGLFCQRELPVRITVSRPRICRAVS